MSDMLYFTVGNQQDTPSAVKKGKNCINPLTLEWVQKVEEDYNSAQWLRQAPDPVYNP